MIQCNHTNDLGLPFDVAPFGKLRAGRAVSLPNGKPELRVDGPES